MLCLQVKSYARIKMPATRQNNLLFSLFNIHRPLPDTQVALREGDLYSMFGESSQDGEIEIADHQAFPVDESSAPSTQFEEKAAVAEFH